ncbi:cystine-binding periplasmic protein precursor [Oxobacter pfennigii]|uniref:Cystine-binding periplasmic protein n=1 Tax=Oxobacter pfennigii TaxID=36849 RepID=A0A0N8NSY1_9CLOT|nr:transporter substrate-binding domain-containing protein [Oxobacter pfennigii]KPU43296.1 cystine-binding periplasmic protein precursor [Oxobacter pfennigii]
MKSSKLTKLFLVLLTLGLILTGCGAPKEPAQTPGGKQKVLVGTEGTYPPFTYEDESGVLTGYDIEVVREIEKRVGDIEIEFVPTPWDSMFLGLESKKFDFIANQIAKNPEREEKYSFTDNNYFVSAAQIIVKGDNNSSINSLDDLKGLKVGTSVGSNYTKKLEEYNAKNNNALDLKYYDGNVTTVFQDIDAGRIDATLNERLTAADNIKKLGLNIKTVGEPVNTVPSYFVFRKGEDELKSKIDKALASMKEDGTLKDISIKWFGEDYTK